MGNCLTTCLPASCKRNKRLGNFNMLPGSRGDFSFLIEEGNRFFNFVLLRSFLSRLFQRRKNRKKKQTSHMVEGLLNPQLSYQRLPESQRVSPQSSYISKDIQLQYLDAGALLERTNTSTPDNSLDLEWEHETLPISIKHEPSCSSWATSIFPEDTLTTQPNQSPLHTECAMHTTDSDYSRVSSSANSLEWDSVHNSVQSECDTIDTDTQFLLNEIDRLTMRALKETGTVMEEESVSYLDDNL
ncbi:unnamed protein product [Ceutorhynchus assimilis]|uniref:Uncharacterized protein n=1 Tax=Ceutorhynchus assimilis TaxID=467358 RepID=A0A9N9QQW0_9CUCU|nr:unnamed protein product [Ceutorhynchus assimilis]